MNKKIRKPSSWDDKVLYAATDIVLLLLLISVAYPIIYVISCSFSSGNAVSSGKVLLWPVDPSIQGYKIVFSYKSVWVGFKNSIFLKPFGSASRTVSSTPVLVPS